MINMKKIVNEYLGFVKIYQYPFIDGEDVVEINIISLKLSPDDEIKEWKNDLRGNFYRKKTHDIIFLIMKYNQESILEEFMKSYKKLPSKDSDENQYMKLKVQLLYKNRGNIDFDILKNPKSTIDLDLIAILYNLTSWDMKYGTPISLIYDNNKINNSVQLIKQVDYKTKSIICMDSFKKYNFPMYVINALIYGMKIDGGIVYFIANNIEQEKIEKVSKEVLSQFSLLKNKISENNILLMIQAVAQLMDIDTFSKELNDLEKK